MNYLHQLLDRVDVELINDELLFWAQLAILAAFLCDLALSEYRRRSGVRRAS